MSERTWNYLYDTIEQKPSQQLTCAQYGKIKVSGLSTPCLLNAHIHNFPSPGLPKQHTNQRQMTVKIPIAHSHTNMCLLIQHNPKAAIPMYRSQHGTTATSCNCSFRGHCGITSQDKVMCCSKTAVLTYDLPNI